VGIGFLFAPKFHKAMKFAAGPRREVGIRTVFNMLGPLTNPASASHQLLGVFSPNLTEPLASVLGNLGVKRAMVVHGNGGLDEISLSGPTRVSELKGDFVETYEVNPSDFGLESIPLESITGGDEETNAGIISESLKGKESPFTEYVIANCSAALVIMGQADDFRSGADIARDLIKSGKGALKLEELVECSRNLKC
jgi:anthranilate phosphoribosyltransferase